MTDGQSGARADVLVGEVFVEFQPDQFAAARVQGFQAQAHLADAFKADDLLIGQRRGIGGVGGGGIVRLQKLIERNRPCPPRAAG